MAAATISDGELLTAQYSADGLRADRSDPKFRAPKRRGKLVWRTELLELLDGARECPLVLVTAPAGYGKTTLLAQWSEHDDRPFVWVTLDDADHDSEALTESIATALRPTGVVRDGFVLVVDDAHEGNPERLRDAALEILEWLPPGSQIVIAARCEPLLPLGRMRAERLLVALGSEELSMSVLEAASLLRNAGLDLEFTAVQEITRRTEGWPAALQLAAGSVIARHESPQSLAGLAGDDHLIADYFRAQFLTGLPPTTRRFVTSCAVLDQMSGPLCDDVLHSSGSGAELARLALTNLPLLPIDPAHEWYRFPGLFREMLQTELRRSEPERLATLHRRAADWYRRAGKLDLSIEHARWAGDVVRCGELVWANLPDYLGSGRNDTVQRWLVGTTAEQAAGCAPFALSAAHSHLATGDIALAEQWARSAGVALSQTTTGDAKAHRAGALIIGAWAARSGATRMGQDAAHAYELLPEDSSWRANCCLLGGTAALLAGEYHAAERQLDEGVARGALMAPDVASLCLAQLAVLAAERDDVEAADDLSRRALELVAQHDLGHYPVLALVFGVATTAGVRQRHVDEAKAAASQCAALLGGLEDFAPWYGAEARILLARGLLALGKVAAARERLAEASQLARRILGGVVFQSWFDDAWEEFDKRAETALIGVGSLTTAELRVLRFLPTHFSFQEIAGRLHVSSNTVKTHVHAVYRKLDASCRSEAVANATRAGLLGP